MLGSGHLRLTSDTALDEGLRLLEQRDPPGFRALIALGGRPPLRIRAPGFEGARIDCGGAAGLDSERGRIFGRLSLALQPLTPDAVDRTEDDVLRRCGLSAIRCERCAPWLARLPTLTCRSTALVQ